MEALALGIRLALDRVVEIVEDTDGDLVGIRIIVAEERRAVQDHLAHRLMSLEIIRHRAEQGIHREGLILEDVFPQRGKAIGYRAQSGTLDIGGVVAGAAVVVVLSLRNAIVVNRERNVAGAYLANMRSI